jgi:Domain of unknown function (DUF4440)/Domain of unknown function (DUF3471)
MISKIFSKTSMLLCLLAIAFTNRTQAQASAGKTMTQDELYKTIAGLDSAFFDSYNTCDLKKFESFIDEDIEFYHDKGGLTTSRSQLVESIKNNICGKVRRELIKGSLQVFPIANYGAIETGEHYFYSVADGKDAKPTGIAKFIQLWQLKDGQWKMTRIFSYDHGPAPYINKRKGIKLSSSTLNQFTGQYSGPQSGIVKVQREKDLLVLFSDNKKLPLYPESETVFFAKERDLTFEFIKNEKGKISKMIVREDGKIAEEAVYQK